MFDNDEVQYGLDGEPIVKDTPSVSNESTFIDEPLDWEQHQEVLAGKSVSLEEASSEIDTFTTLTNQLIALDHTVSVEGICKEDFRTLGVIQTKLQEMGVDLTTVSNESYMSGLFTDERSSTCLSVAQESFLKTMVQTVKEWIAKLIAFLGRVVDWAVSNIWGEPKYERKLQRGYNAWERAREVRVKAELLVGKQGPIAAEMQGYAENLIEHENLKRTIATLSAFGSRPATAAIEKKVGEFIKAVKELKGTVDKIKTDFESPTGPIRSANNISLTVNILANDILDFIDPSQTLNGQGKNTLGRMDISNKIFNEPIRKETSTVTPFEDIVKECRELQRRLKTMKRFERKEKIATLTDTLNDLNGSIAKISQVISACKEINDTKLQIIGLYINYENHYINQIIRVTKDELKDEGKLERITRMVNEVRDNIINSR
jgi:hypothetical protein